MCLLFISYRSHPQFPLIVAANRDEFHARPTAAAAFWEDPPSILAGKDLEHGGAWLGVSRAGRFGAVTNVRSGTTGSAPRSRGLLVKDYLSGDESVAAFTANLEREADEYDGFNILVADHNSLAWYSNRERRRRVLPPGVYGLSNDSLDAPWPKITRLKRRLAGIEGLARDELIALALDTLADAQPPPDDELPDTGVGLAMERTLAPVFIDGELYGTRCSTVVLFDKNDEVSFAERRFGPKGAQLGENRFSFEIHRRSS